MSRPRRLRGGAAAQRRYGRSDRHRAGAPWRADVLAIGAPASVGAWPWRRLLAVCAIAAAAVAMCAGPLARPADAATYDVAVCGINGNAGSSDGLTVIDNPRTHFGAIDTINRCSTATPGISQAATTSGSSGGSWYGDGSWTLSAPSGTTIQSLAMNRTFSGFGTYLIYELRTGSGTLLETATLVGGKQVPANGTRSFSVNSSSVTGRFYCLDVGLCVDTTGTSVWLSGLTATMSDTSAPTLNSALAGSLFDPGSVSGTRGVRFDASDLGSGIYRVALLVDGVENQSITPDANGGRCVAPFEYLAPCPASMQSTFWVNTRLISEGEHQVQLAVYDATNTNRVVSAAQSVTVDNFPAPSGGVPALDGAMVDGQQLSADPGVWQNATGTYTYDYLRCNAAGANCSQVAGANGTTYALGLADVGSTLRLRVTAINSAGETTQATSDPTGVIQPRLAAPVAAPTVSGVVQVGQPLAGSDGTWDGTPTITYSYRWLRCDAFALCSPIPGATASTYTPTGADVEMSLRLEVTATNGAGSASAQSASSAIVPPVAPTSTTAPSISGTAQDRLTLTAQDGTFDGAPAPSITRAWERCDQAGSCVAIDGATATTYTATADDVGSTLRVAVTAHNDGGSLTVYSAQTAPVAPMTPVAIEQPSISGAFTEGIALAGHPGLWDGTPTITYSFAWARCQDDGSACQQLPTATDASYTPAPADVDHRLRLTVTASNAAGPVSATSALTALIAARAPVSSSLPSIDGTVSVGAPLTASPGAWDGTAPIAYTYAWSSCDALGDGCAEIPNATGSTYTPTTSDVGYTLQVAVRATNVAGTRTATSEATVAVPAVAPTSTQAPAITGNAVDASTLQADDGAFDGTPEPTVTRVWERCEHGVCTPVDGASEPTYRLGVDDIGSTIQVAVTATNAGGTITVRSAPTVVVEAAAPLADEVPSIAGAGTEGVALDGDPGTWSGTAPIARTLSWMRCSASGEPASCSEIPDATDATYVPSTADIGHRLRLQATATNQGGQSTSLSDPTRPIIGRPPVNEAPPTITGQTTDGQTLSASAGEWSGTPEIRTDPTWLRCDASGGQCTAVADSTDYELGPDDVGHTMRERVHATNIADETTAVSDPTALVLARAPDNVRDPQIQVAADALLTLGPPRTVRSDATLTVAGDLWDGTGSLETTIAWERCSSAQAQTCSRIPDANARTYALDSADAGAAIRAEVLAANQAGSAHAYTAPVLVDHVATPQPPLPAAGSTPRPAPTTARAPSQLRIGQPSTTCRPLMRRVLDAGLGTLRADGTLPGTTRVRAGQRALLSIAVHSDAVVVKQDARTLARATGVHGLHWTQRSAEQLVLQSQDDRLLLAIGRNPHHPTLVVAKARLCTTATPSLQRVSALAGQQVQLAVTLSATSGRPIPRAVVHLDDADQTTLSTDGNGVAHLQLRAAGSRRVQITYAGDTDHAPATLALPVNVAATTTITLLSGSIPTNGPAEFVGRLQGPGNATGTRIRLDYKTPHGRWQTAGTARADAHGRWHLTSSRPTTAPRQTLVLYHASIQPGPHYPYQPRSDAPATFHLADRSKP